MRSVLTCLLTMLFAALALDIAVPALVLVTAVILERAVVRLVAHGRLLPRAEAVR